MFNLVVIVITIPEKLVKVFSISNQQKMVKKAKDGKGNCD